MSSHREAPEISKDPVADSTDVYAFMSPDKSGMVTLIANYIPLEAPDGGPNFYEFADDVLYEIHIDNTGDGNPDISYQFTFTTVNNIPSSFLYNDGPITSLTPPSPSSNWNRQQTYTLTRVDNNPRNRWGASSVVLGSGLLCPPCNIGPLSTPNYAALAATAVHSVGAGPFSAQVFVGQRAEGFYVDLGAVFDLGDLRGFAGDHAGGPAAGLLNGMPGVNSTADVNVHTLALQIPPRSSRGPLPQARVTRPPSSGSGPRRAVSESGCGAIGSTGETSGAVRGRRCHASATRWPTSSSSASAPKTCGTRNRPRQTARNSSVTSPSRCCRNCCRASTRESFRTWRVTTAASPTRDPISRRSSSLVSQPV